MTIRTYQHIIDTRAIKKVLNTFPDHWVVRELSERDYGIDLLIEIFDDYGEDNNGHQQYESTGNILNIQVKGTDKRLKHSQNKAIDFRLKRKNLQYFEKFAIPFILLRVDISNENENIYFVWLQKYIKKKLDSDFPEWRTEVKHNNKGEVVKEPSYKIEIPTQNILSSNLDKIETFASRIKYLEELSEYVEIYTTIKDLSEETALGQIQADSTFYTNMLNEARKISRLKSLIKHNKCGITSKKVEKFIFQIGKDGIVVKILRSILIKKTLIVC